MTVAELSKVLAAELRNNGARARHDYVEILCERDGTDCSTRGNTSPQKHIGQDSGGSLSNARESEGGEVKLTSAERTFLRHFRKPWWNIVNKKSFYVLFGTETGREWTPRGPTGATAASLMRKGLIDFEPKPRRIGKLMRTPGSKNSG